MKFPLIPRSAGHFLAVAIFTGNAAATVVTTSTDEDDGLLGGGTGISLREAITHSPPGTTVTFDQSLSGSTIQMGIETEPFIIKNNLIIDGSALDAPIIISGNTLDIIFSVRELTSATFRSISTKNSGTLYNNDGTLILESCMMSENISTSGGQGIIVNSGNATISDTSITGSPAIDQGPAIINNAGVMTIRSSIIQNNRTNEIIAPGLAGGIVNLEGTLILESVTLVGNSGEFSGGIYSGGGQVSIHDSTISNNTSTHGAGGIQCATGTLTVERSSISKNTGETGGIFSKENDTTIRNSTISENKSSKHSSFAGGISHTSSTEENNLLTLISSTISGNSASKTWGGIAILGGSCEVIYCTITENKSLFESAGIYSSNAESITIASSIVRDNSGGDLNYRDANGVPFISQGFNIVGQGNGVVAFDKTGDISGTEIPIRLAPLGNYGGSTQTMPPLFGSPAINAAEQSNLITTDQRGNPRGTLPDIGATEAGSPIIVTTLLDNDPSKTTLRDAMAQALPSGTQIQFEPNLFPGTIELDQPLIARENSAVIIDASNIPDGVTLDAQKKFRVLEIGSSSDIFLHSVNLSSGKSIDGNDGAGLRNAGSSILVNCTISNNDTTTGRGGGIWNIGSVVIFDSRIENNSSQNGGGIWNSGTLSLTSSIITTNAVTNNGCGGGISNYGNAWAVETIIENNRSGSGRDALNLRCGGGGIYNDGTFDIHQSNIVSNRTADGRVSNYTSEEGGAGGGILNYRKLTITDSTISMNSTGKGHPEIVRSVLGSDLPEIIHSTNGGDGGGIANLGTIDARSTIISENKTGPGGFSFAGGGSPLNYSTSGDGGGIWNSGDASFTRCLVSQNKTGDLVLEIPSEIPSFPGNGGGLANFGIISLVESTIEGNRTGIDEFRVDRDQTRFAGNGGGIFNVGTLQASRSTLNSNHASLENGFGGAIFSHSDSTAHSNTIHQCTLHGNTAVHGGGYYNSAGESLFEFCTITGNEDGGIVNNGSLEVESIVVASIIRDNLKSDVSTFPENSLDSTFSSLGHNIIGTGSGVAEFDAETDQAGDRDNLYLSPLGHYGGNTQTRVPFPGSSAIGKISNFSDSFLRSNEDQRGMPRSSLRRDIGAVEFNDSDLEKIIPFFWNDDSDGDGIASGIEFALGSDQFLGQNSTGRDFDFSLNEDGIPQIKFGVNPSAVGNTHWIIERSSELATWEEVYRSTNPGQLSDTTLIELPLADSTITLMDSKGNTPAYYRFTASITSPEP